MLNTADVSISESAAKRIAFLMQQESSDAKLRVSVQGGGCSGFQYGFDFDSEINDDDLVLERDGAVVLIDETSLEFMQGASDRSQQLIVDLLDYSRIGRQKELTKLDVSKIVNEVMNDLSVKISETNAVVEFEQLPVIHGYRTYFRLLIQNLISNAIKFSKPGIPPIVNISCIERDSEYEFAIADNGIGIDEKYFDRIFVIFKRLHGKSEYEGTGIGLAHCKKVIDLHHGRIWVSSKVGEGTTFHFTIPKQIEDEEA